MKLQFNSLRNKIILSYYVIILVFIFLVLFAFFELKLFEGNIRKEENIVEIFDDLLEIRRFEKNYFLYHHISDYEENQKYTARTRQLLQSHPATLYTQLVPTPLPTTLANQLEEYINLMQQYTQKHDPNLELLIRQIGKQLVNYGEQLIHHQRVSQIKSLFAQQNFLLISTALLTFVVIALGRWLSWRVVYPLRLMETEMKNIADGSLRKLNFKTKDHEVVLLVEAVNKMLEEIHIRQHYLIRSEKLAALGGVAHELNNPLSNISTSCQILHEDMDTLEKEHKMELLTQIDEQVERARYIVQSLLDFTRVKHLRREWVELLPLLKKTLTLLHNDLPHQGSIRLEVPENFYLEGDPQRLQQAFFNLLKNAMESIPDSGEIHFQASDWRPGEMPALPNLASMRHFGSHGVCIKIQDNGAGIPDSLLPHIFDPFLTTKDAGHGYGLGLFIVREIIEEHHGDIHAENLPEGGAMFTLWLPISERNDLI